MYWSIVECYVVDTVTARRLRCIFRALSRTWPKSWWCSEMCEHRKCEPLHGVLDMTRFWPLLPTLACCPIRYPLSTTSVGLTHLLSLSVKEVPIREKH